MDTKTFACDVWIKSIQEERFEKQKKLEAKMNNAAEQVKL